VTVRPAVAHWWRDCTPSAPTVTTADATFVRHMLPHNQRAVGAVFDRDVLLLSARSEIGAASMARTELAAGTYPPTRTLAQAISGAPQSEIPELQALAAGLPS